MEDIDGHILVRSQMMAYTFFKDSWVYSLSITNIELDTCSS